MVLSFFLRLNLSPKRGEAKCLLGLLEVSIDGCASELSASPRLPRLPPLPRLMGSASPHLTGKQLEL